MAGLNVLPERQGSVRCRPHRPMWWGRPRRSPRGRPRTARRWPLRPGDVSWPTVPQAKPEMDAPSRPARLRPASGCWRGPASPRLAAAQTTSLPSGRPRVVDVNRVSEPEGRVHWAASPDVVRQFPSKPGARGPRAGRRSPLRPRGASWATVPQAAPKMDTSSPPAGVSHRLEAGDGLRHSARPAQTHPSAGSAAGRADVELLTRTGGAGSFVGQVAPCGVTASVTARCGTKDLSRPRPPRSWAPSPTAAGRPSRQPGASSRADRRR